jgi:hypothetical protein
MARVSAEMFTAADRAQLQRRGLSVDEAVRQAELMANSLGSIKLDRPCTVDDGIERIPADSHPELNALHAEAAAAGRVSGFVPASGAASRMFKDLLFYQARPGEVGKAEIEADLQAGKGEAKAVKTFVGGLSRFAFRAALAQAVRTLGGDFDALAANGPYRPILDALLTARGLDYAELPKGLLQFHLYSDGPRTPFEEHLVEGASLAKDKLGRCKLHFTVSPHHLARFEALLSSVREHYEKRFGARFEVSFSLQKASTDTIAIDLDNQPVREKDGTLLFRPAGHGALLENLQDQLADVVLLKNIDNVASEPFKSPTFIWSKLLVGHLLKLQKQIHQHLHALEKGADSASVESALQFARSVLKQELPSSASDLAAKHRWVRELLDRPVRVCGMVPNTGEPGGGPFWVREKDGSKSKQVVESAQVDAADPEQKKLSVAATHFNPVFIVCGVRDHHGVPYELSRYLDPDAVIVTKKSSGGKELKALERPGLWNGAMARWTTAFVEVAIEVFNPVKTVNDLLKREHQPAS